MHLYQVRPRKDKRGVDLISDVLPFGALWYTKARRCRLREFGGSCERTSACAPQMRNEANRGNDSAQFGV